MKKIRLTVEWPGACSEADWASVMMKAIEDFDESGLTKVTDFELVTDFGTTEPLTLPSKRSVRCACLGPYWLIVIAVGMILYAIAVR